MMSCVDVSEHTLRRNLLVGATTKQPAAMVRRSIQVDNVSDTRGIDRHREVAAGFNDERRSGRKQW